MNRLFILLPVHNRKATTRRIIACFQQQTFKEYRLILIDDGSTDGTADIVQEMIPSVTILRGRGDWWWGGALHQGYKWLAAQSLTASDMVVLMNDDSVFDSAYFETAVSILNQQRHTLLVSCAFNEKDGRVFDGGVHANWKHWKFSVEHDPSLINCASTRGLFLWADEFISLGGFYPRLLPHYGSDYEFTIRAYNKGFKLLVDERLKLWVNENTTGIRSLRNKDSYGAFLKSMFSKRSTLNPIYLTTFVSLACPWPWKFSNWARIWLSTLWKMMRNFFTLVLFKNKRHRHEGA
jgi:GT2 family glycosyltransferase